MRVQTYLFTIILIIFVLCCWGFIYRTGSSSSQKSKPLSSQNSTIKTSKAYIPHLKKVLQALPSKKIILPILPKLAGRFDFQKDANECIEKYKENEILLENMDQIHKTLGERGDDFEQKCIQNEMILLFYQDKINDLYLRNAISFKEFKELLAEILNWHTDQFRDLSNEDFQLMFGMEKDEAFPNINSLFLPTPESWVLETDPNIPLECLPRKDLERIRELFRSTALAENDISKWEESIEKDNQRNFQEGKISLQEKILRDESALKKAGEDMISLENYYHQEVDKILHPVDF